ncbi:uncharacterized protein MONBRDRAFT_33672 [Monosiga brevicollis MX1]|uniref:ThuA-like domain-containing protein n=1 Tax=Monosiga brevicollis TaxID=81824 RepID=A9V6H5_MONBE|nr:uncharacterized protein MONBRDRAFT_33672 [Monosiga brevicollis MX1]EDQ86808.1 predicted protein [Monosiga brevicollis MX1]|eukprot:XP_001748353.1 hypothetical protein [Monosiga brevicollis MX1]
MAPANQILVLNLAKDYVHDCIPVAAACVKRLGTKLGAEVVVSETAEPYFDTIEELGKFNVLVFNSNSGELFNNTQKAVFEEYVRGGYGSLLGLHSATAAFLSGADASGATVMATTYPFFADTWGASFTDHPPIQDGVVYTDREACTAVGLDLPTSYPTSDEWYNFDRNPTENDKISILAFADVSKITGNKMGEHHPLIWCHKALEKTPVFYTALGHHAEAYESDETVIEMVRAGLKWCLDQQGTSEHVAH